MLPPGGRVVIALSGGPDSVALVHILRELEQAGHLRIAGLAHFNHQLRGDASAADEQFCRDLASAVGLPIEVGRGNVRDVARREKRSIEDAARRLRYAFLHEAAAALHADAVAVGHSREDQAETFLLRLLRGAGTRGLGSIRPRAGVIVRPLLDVSRAELRRFLADRGVSSREDASNADVTVPRNRVRHELLPYLQREFSPGIVEVLAREAALALEDDERLEAEAIDLAASVVLTNTAPEDAAPRVTVDATALVSLHPALASRVARVALRQLGGDRFIGFEHIQRFLELARTGEAGNALSLPGQQARLEAPGARGAGRRITLGPEPARGVETEANSFRIPLSIPGEVVLSAQRLAVSADWADGLAPGDSQRELAAFVKGLNGPLAVRSRQPGDRFQPPGLGGRARKLQDYLVDRKVARADRDLLPLVVDRDDRIVWIVGHAVAEGFRAAEPSPGVILLKAKYLGGEV
ncbi:MAG TPA: tRNA lysidine(34) synthetase TilS [Vicinamibacterales bacterium]|nr:tRNA lysidine(34) synthetase TilS [Vicinamibacterales bacterium]